MWFYRMRPAPYRRGPVSRYRVTTGCCPVLERADERWAGRVELRLALPPDTVCGWDPARHAAVEWLRVQGTTAAHAFDPLHPPIAVGRVGHLHGGDPG